MRQVRDRIEPLNAQAPERAPVQQQVAASPTDALGVPRPANQMEDLAQALSSLNPALQKFAERKQKEEADQKIAEGERHRAMQADNAPVAMTPEQNPYWQIGYMRQHGKMMGLQASADMEKEFALRRNEQGFNPDSFFAEFRQKELAGMTDKDALGGMLPALTGTEARLRDQWGKKVVDDVRQNEANALNAGAAALVTSLRTLPAEQRQPTYKSFIDEQVRTNRMTQREAAQAVVAALANDPEAKPSDFDWTLTKDDSGIALADVAGPGGAPMRHALEAAKAHAVKREQDQLTAEAKSRNTITSVEYARLLKEDPVALGDPTQWVLSNSGQFGLYNTPEKVEAGFKELWDAQKKKKDEDSTWAYILKAGKFAPRAVREQPEYKKKLNAMNRDQWMKTDLNDPKQVAGLTNFMLHQYNELGVLDEGFESMLKASNTAGVEFGPDGKPTNKITSEFRTSFEVYRAVLASANPQLVDFMPDGARAILGTFKDELENGATEADAFRVAKLINTEEAKKRGNLAFDSATERAAAVNDVASYLTSNLRFNGNGFGISADNAKEMGNKVVERAVRYVKMGMNTKTALKTARDEFTATHVHDGHSSFVAIPPGVNRDEMSKDLSVFVAKNLADYKAQHGLDASSYFVQPTLNGSETSYQVFGPMMIPIGEPMTVSQLHQAGVKARHQDPQSVADAQNAIADAQAGRITPEAAQANFPRTNELFNAGVLDARTYERINAAKKAKDEADFKAGLDKVRKTRSTFAIPQGDFMDGTKDMHIGAPVPNPTGANLSTKDYAAQYAKSNPDFALTAFAEGLRLGVYEDSVGKKTIGLGYNIDSRSPEQVRKEFTAAGIAGDRIDRVLKGEEQITPREAVRLYEVVKPTYVARAKKHFGPEWEAFPENVKAVLTDIAYNGGSFSNIVEDLKAGRFDDAAGKVSVSYFDKKLGKQVYNTRRVNLWRAMMDSTDTFESIVKRGA